MTVTTTNPDMPASKRRLRWAELPEDVRRRVEDVAGGRVIAAENMTGGFSPGLAARLRLADGGAVFAKAIDGRWPIEAGFHRAEAGISAALPAGVPASRLRGSFDDGDWIGLVFDHVDGREPALPWRPADLTRVLAATAELARVGTPCPVDLPTDHPRLGGWRTIAGPDGGRDRLRDVLPPALNHLDQLVELECQGLDVARGDSLVHGDLYPHNVLLTDDRAVIVDWPHARRGNPLIDVITLLSTTVVFGHEPEPHLAAHPLAAAEDPHRIDALLAAHAGFCVAGALPPVSDEYRPIAAAKYTLGSNAYAWLRHRLASR